MIAGVCSQLGMPPVVVVSIAVGLPVAGLFLGLLVFGRRGASVREMARVMLVVEVAAAVAVAVLLGVAASAWITGCSL